ncbi:MAG: diguanylate cyclase [Clostridiales bacterium]|nr:diguanylate cyclase [Clostridiales bacterium]
MGFDIKTLVLCNFMINLVNVFVLAVVWQQYRKIFSGLNLLLIDMILQAVGFLLILCRGILPDIITIVLSNTLLIGGAVCVLHGLEKFFRVTSKHFGIYFLMLLYCSVLIYLSIAQPNLGVREIFISLMIMLVTSQICRLLIWRIEPGFQKMARFLLVVFCVYSITSFIRAILLIVFPLQTSDFFKSSYLDALFIASYLVLSVFVSMGIVLIVNRRLLEEVQGQKEKYQTTFRLAPYAIILTKLSDGEIIEVNDAFEQISGYQMQEAVGYTTIELNIWNREEDRQYIVDELSKGHDVHNYEMHFRNKKGNRIIGMMSASIVEFNEVPCIISTVGDITDQSLMREKLHDLAMHDGLTGLANRMLFFDRFEIAAANAQREKKNLAILSIDLDAFKTINDEYGHNIGDMILVEVGTRVMNLLRKIDTFARFGGDEFVLLIWDVQDKKDVITVID